MDECVCIYRVSTTTKRTHETTLSALINFDMVAGLSILWHNLSQLNDVPESRAHETLLDVLSPRSLAAVTCAPYEITPNGMLFVVA